MSRKVRKVKIHYRCVCRRQHHTMKAARACLATHKIRRWYECPICENYHESQAEAEKCRDYHGTPEEAQNEALMRVMGVLT